MVPADFQPFFIASVAASSALIGLLFVSVSVAPERVFGTQAEPVRQAQALSAFTALANVFFISFACLIPGVVVGAVISVIAIPAALQTLALLGLIRHWRAEGIIYRGLLLFLGSAIIYAFELVLGIQLWRGPVSSGALSGLLELLLGAYAIGLGRAWELLGAPRSGYVSTVVSLVRSRLGHARETKP
jgi:hypothetical protein